MHLDLMATGRSRGGGEEEEDGSVTNVSEEEEEDDSESDADSSDDEEDDGWDESIYGSADADGRLVIPSTVTEIENNAFEYCEGLKSVVISNSVTSIGDEAFIGCKGLKSVTIPDSVTSIGRAAFGCCTGLTDVAIPNSVTEIEEGAFIGCDGLTFVTIPDSVTSIEKRAFKNCTGLTDVAIPNSVTEIEESAFSGCTGLTDVTISDSVTTIGGYAFENCTGLTDVAIPDSVAEIGERAFEGCTGLTALTIGDSVTLIGEGAFSGCTALTDVTISDSVTTIGGYAFKNCTGLTDVTISDSVTTIGGYAFKNCTGLTDVAIPDSVAEIGERAFEGCTGLTDVAIPNSVTEIEEGAFSGCTGLTDVTISDSVTTIGGYAFKNCTGLTDVAIPDSVAEIGERAFDGCTGLTSVTLSNSVTSIECNAFEGCTGLTALTIGDSVTSIGVEAFKGCTRLTSVAIPDSVTLIGDDAFSSCASLTMVTIQDGSKVEFNPESITANSPFATVVDLAAEERRYISECPKLQMVQFSNNTALANPQTTTLFDADQAKETKALIKTIPLHGAFETEMLPALLFASAADTTATTTAAAAAATETIAANTTALRYQQMVDAQLTLPHPDTAPLSERLSSLKDVLNICLQFELTAPSPAIHNTVDFKPHMKMYVDPAIVIIKQAVDTMKAQVAADPDKYRHLLAHLSTGDKHIYVECFGKTINSDLGGDEATYKMMLKTITDLKSGCAMAEVHVQPTSELMPLILMVRENVPAYKAIVISVVDSCGLDIRQVLVSFRHETKAPYRVIEKSLTKGPNPDYPDVSKVLDVFGCLINCTDYVSMAAVVKAFATKHNNGELQLTRVKDRWTYPSGGGWRDLMLNLVINGIVFEVQIVHTKMLAARKGLDAHKAYNQFRSFAEIFDMLDLDPGLNTVVAGGDDGGDGSAVVAVGNGGDDGMNANVVQLYRQLRADFEAERAAHAATEEELGAERAAHAATEEELGAERAARAESEQEVLRLRNLVATGASRSAVAVAPPAVDGLPAVSEPALTA